MGQRGFWGERQKAAKLQEVPFSKTYLGYAKFQKATESTSSTNQPEACQHKDINSPAIQPVPPWLESLPGAAAAGVQGMPRRGNTWALPAQTPP